ncbi:MAG: chromate transporter [Candidatus Eisenbacteria bacterium]|nr:chromate transporter [Candidatus Latescibacterota bacterium]MBD3302957.1 chromate transporter [Candidatus Eisenbacteria bacterium]
MRKGGAKKQDVNEVTIFWVFLRLGVVGFGTGPAMVPLMEAEAVDRYRWLTPEAFTDALGACNALPGPIATKMAYYIGAQAGGLAGGIAAVVGVILPSTIAVAVAAGLLLRFQRSEIGGRFLLGIRPAVVALLLALAWDLAPTSLRGVRPVLLGLAVFLAVVILKVHPAIALVASGLLGILFLR